MKRVAYALSLSKETWVQIDPLAQREDASWGDLL